MASNADGHVQRGPLSLPVSVQIWLLSGHPVFAQSGLTIQDVLLTVPVVFVILSSSQAIHSPTPIAPEVGR